jgi:hypothetical protein
VCLIMIGQTCLCLCLCLCICGHVCVCACARVLAPVLLCRCVRLCSPCLRIVCGSTKGFVYYGGFTHVGSPPTLYPSSLQLPLSSLSLSLSLSLSPVTTFPSPSLSLSCSPLRDGADLADSSPSRGTRAPGVAALFLGIPSSILRAWLWGCRLGTCGDLQCAREYFVCLDSAVIVGP